MKFSVMLKNLRNEKGVSQYTLAKELFVSRSIVAKWENGLALPKDYMKKAIIDYFKVPKDYFENSEEDKIKEFENINKRCFRNKIRNMILAFASLVLVFIAYLIIDYFTINPGYYFNIYDNGLYKYAVKGDEVRLDSYIGKMEDFCIPESVEIRGNIVKRKYTVNSVNLTNLNLEKLYIPKTIKNITHSGACFQYVEVSKDNPYFDSRENSNCIISKENNGLVLASKRNSVIPNSVEGILENAFTKTEYKSIELPDLVKFISYKAFSDMDNLENIELNQNLSRLDERIFEGCSKLKSFVLPSSLQEINYNALACSSVEAVYFISNEGDFKKYYALGAQDEHYFLTSVPTFKLYFYSYYEPQVKGNTWHYVDGNIEVWR